MCPGRGGDVFILAHKTCVPLNPKIKPDPTWYGRSPEKTVTPGSELLFYIS